MFFIVEKKENFISFSLNIMKWFVLNSAFLLFISQLLFLNSDDPTAVPAAEPVPASNPTPALTPTPVAVVVPECPYKAADNGSLICPDAKNSGSIPTLMQCANEIKTEFGKICKSKTFFSSFSLSHSPNMYQSLKLSALKVSFAKLLLF
jgi:hypothetical protein